MQVPHGTAVSPERFRVQVHVATGLGNWVRPQLVPPASNPEQAGAPNKQLCLFIMILQFVELSKINSESAGNLPVFVGSLSWHSTFVLRGLEQDDESHPKLSEALFFTEQLAAGIGAASFAGRSLRTLPPMILRLVRDRLGHLEHLCWSFVVIRQLNAS